MYQASGADICSAVALLLYCCRLWVLQVYNYSFWFCWWALLIVASYVLGFTVLGVLFMKYVSWLKR